MRLIHCWFCGLAKKTSITTTTTNTGSFTLKNTKENNNFSQQQQQQPIYAYISKTIEIELNCQDGWMNENT
ncbi:hypothetical protein DERP_000746 [Dermatophagoides pteronyssinus]|uniref:Uncharacterized protein n=1 Tax=Dermatophagoides pteronyssinus TaxID=6956 RepID=A0ABQ8J157_DERPT|nr:hypothetical protein DERP_000746 [Dermatophagoides pteronyssinus]